MCQDTGDLSLSGAKYALTRLLTLFDCEGIPLNLDSMNEWWPAHGDGTNRNPYLHLKSAVKLVI